MIAIKKHKINLRSIKMKRIIFAALFLTMLSYTSMLAQPFYGKGNPDRQCMADLNLNDAQEKQLNDFRFEHQEKVIDLKAEMQKNKLEIKKMMTANEVDEKKLRDLTKANSNVREKIHSSKVDMWLNIYKILNKDQQEEWTEHFARMGDGNKHGKKIGRHARGNMFEKKDFDRPMMKKRMQYKMDTDD